MKKYFKILALLSLSSVLVLSGCRRQTADVQTETASETETETETTSETETETASETETETETEKATEAETEEQTEEATEAETEAATEAQTEAAATEAQTEAATEAQTEAAEVAANTQDENATDICPYCYGTFSTVVGEDGTSEHSAHVAAEAAYAEYLNSIGYQTSLDPENGYTVDTTYNTITNTAQCPYCGYWFSDDSTYGYSEYAQHIAAEEASAYQQQEQYYQCPYCGIWLDYDTYQDHVNNGY